jgi:uncharacterized protein YacL
LVLRRHVAIACSCRGLQLSLLPGALLSLLLKLLLKTLLDTLLGLLLRLLLSALLNTLLPLLLGLLLGTLLSTLLSLLLGALLGFVGQALSLQRRVSVLAHGERYRGDKKNRDRRPTRNFVFHHMSQAMDANVA